MLKQKEMQNFRREGGITLIALIITIIILVILAAVSINAAYNSGIINYAVNGTENYIREAEKEKGAIQNAQTVLENALLNVNPFVENKGVNTPKITEGMIPIKWNGTNWVVCARDDKDWYDYASPEDILEDPTRQMAWANMMLSDGKYKAETVEVGQVVADADLGSMFVWIPRYAYSMTHYKSSFAGTADENNGTTQNITNVVFLKGTTNYGADGHQYGKEYTTNPIVEEETEKIVHPAFTFGGKELTGIWVAKFEASMEGNNTNKTANNNDNALSKTVKILPNAESWRYIAVGNAFKVCYEMRNKIDDETNKNVYGITTNTNTHLMKNTEWGCVAYLAASQYGTIPAFNADGEKSGYIYHAYTAGSSTSRDYETNKSQSTTGTVHGVYDLNGGAYEYVAAYFDNQNDNLANGNFTNATNAEKSFVQNATTNKYEINSTYAAYWDKYDVYSNPYYAEEGDIDGSYGYDFSSNESSLTGSQANSLIAKAAYEKVQLMKNKKGDAMYEVIDDSSLTFFGWMGPEYTSNKWIQVTNDAGNLTIANDTEESNATGLYGGDLIRIGTYIRPFISRGDYWGKEGSAGLFSLDGTHGGTSGSYGFRPAITQ